MSQHQRVEGNASLVHSQHLLCPSLIACYITRQPCHSLELSHYFCIVLYWDAQHQLSLIYMRHRGRRGGGGGERGSCPLQFIISQYPALYVG